jgi:hypothetical protein
MRAGQDRWKRRLTSGRHCAGNGELILELSRLKDLEVEARFTRNSPSLFLSVRRIGLVFEQHEKFGHGFCATNAFFTLAQRGNLL